MYQDKIKKELLKLGREDINPRHIEAFMRLNHNTLDGLNKSQFTEEVFICSGCVDSTLHKDYESLVKSFNL